MSENTAAVKTITKAQHLQLIGLRALAMQHVTIAEQCEEAMNAMLEADTITGGAGDVVFGGRTLEWLLERAGVVVQS